MASRVGPSGLTLSLKPPMGNGSSNQPRSPSESTARDSPLSSATYSDATAGSVSALTSHSPFPHGMEEIGKPEAVQPGYALQTMDVDVGASKSLLMASAVGLSATVTPPPGTGTGTASATPPNRLTPTFNSFDEYSANALLSSSGNFDFSALERFDKLDAKLEADMWEKRRWKVLKVPEDGNCFWRCLAYWVWSDINLYARARSLVLRHMLHHPSTYSPFVLDSEPYATYCARKSREHQYANHVEAQASANYFGRTVDVWTYPSWGGAADDGFLMRLEAGTVEPESSSTSGQDGREGGGGGESGSGSGVSLRVERDDAAMDVTLPAESSPPPSIMAWTPDSPLAESLGAHPRLPPPPPLPDLANLEPGQGVDRYRYPDGSGPFPEDGTVRVVYQRSNHYNVLRPALPDEPPPTLDLSSAALRGTLEPTGGAGAWSAWRQKSSSTSASDKDMQEAIRLSMMEQYNQRRPSNASSMSPPSRPTTLPYSGFPSPHHALLGNASSSSLLNPSSRRHSMSRGTGASSGVGGASQFGRIGGGGGDAGQMSTSPAKSVGGGGEGNKGSEGEIFAMEP
ncbi:hypothetical protein M427DRAFT_41519 [Gonapodya prolifera JEL478]|uniref:ubiquitinyl hydrolase 1 n=1 Tax=Gonapodya prolifera (strain JEL478) TaxID=1344416 RepID=A0A139AUI0_GONPJ|nr:hypothetical protein M427DRAFT_41519 [Gonapodya prolifera JEL478]|eukprot:KXS20233.1 hypothetical protein M427DRAFT_41519 [Gonapodya prolifera JEL478]